MAKYFLISYGLRGGYMYSSSYAIRCGTRRELKEAISYEAESLASGDRRAFGLSKRAIATAAADMWREAHKPRVGLPLCLPVRWEGESHAHSGLFVDVLSRREYLEWQESQD